MEERNLEITNPDTGETIMCPHKGYWIYVDGALGASYMPFLQMAYHQGYTDIKPGPIFDFDYLLFALLSHNFCPLHVQMRLVLLILLLVDLAVAYLL